MHDAFHPIAHETKAHKRLINLQTGLTSPPVSTQLRTASESRLFPQLTNSCLLTTDYQYSGYCSCSLEYCLHRTKKYGSRGHKIGTHVCTCVARMAWGVVWGVVWRVKGVSPYVGSRMGGIEWNYGGPLIG